mmetsp:Transcript_37289/g.43401  ORF Transcript_37289/g.43401 Transcript_37289/m.43401 type:complete len:85 (+) Transcript_37289:159-413(+)
MGCQTTCLHTRAPLPIYTHIINEDLYTIYSLEQKKMQNEKVKRLMKQLALGTHIMEFRAFCIQSHSQLSNQRAFPSSPFEAWAD